MSTLPSLSTWNTVANLPTPNLFSVRVAAPLGQYVTYDLHDRTWRATDMAVEQPNAVVVGENQLMMLSDTDAARAAESIRRAATGAPATSTTTPIRQAANYGTFVPITDYNSYGPARVDYYSQYSSGWGNPFQDVTERQRERLRVQEELLEQERALSRPGRPKPAEPKPAEPETTEQKVTKLLLQARELSGKIAELHQQQWQLLQKAEQLAGAARPEEPPRPLEV